VQPPPRHESPQCEQQAENRTQWYCKLIRCKVQKLHCIEVNYTCLKKLGHAYYASQLLQMWINFNNFFTVAFYDELQKKLEHDLPPHLESVAAVPCEN